MGSDANSVELPELLEIAQSLAREAGHRILSYYEGDCEVRSKADKTPVTEADLAAHDVIVNGLRVLTPDIPVLSEESERVPYAHRRAWKRYWLIDPLDGTREFIKRNGEFCVNIALIHRHEVELGVVYAPVSGLMYWAVRHHGAFKQTAKGGAAVPIRVRPRPRGPVVVAGSRSHRGKSLQRFLQRLGEHELIGMGSALKSCLVAEGGADIYPRLGPTGEWDTAAAQCIVEEAGGRVVDLSGRPLRYNTKNSLANPHFLVIGDGEHDWLHYIGSE